MGTVSGTERRRDPRVERDDLALRLSLGGRPIHVDQLRDASPAGFGVQVASEIKAGQTLSFILEAGGAAVSGTAKVVWAEPFHMGWRGGLEVSGLGWLGRRRLRAVLSGAAGREGWLDVVLVVVAAVAAALVCVDLAMNPTARADLLKQLRSLLGR